MSEICLSPWPRGPLSSAHFNIHVPMELRDGSSWQPAPQVEPITILRHHMLHLEDNMVSVRDGGSALRQRNYDQPSLAKGQSSQNKKQLQPGRALR